MFYCWQYKSSACANSLFWPG